LVRDDLITRLARELETYRSPWEDAARRAHLVAVALPRIAGALDLLPPATGDSRLLELGSEPFFTSQCLHILWPGQATYANYYGTAERHGAHTLVEVGGAGAKTFAYDLFNIETDPFPYPDASFDVVLFCELVEHLAINPVLTLAEIHRVLKPGGHLIVTTPNVLSIERLECYARAARLDVDRYNPTFGYGARHNREYSPAELRLLLEETGFDIESLAVRDLGERSLAERLRRSTLKRVLRLWSPEPRDSHIFARARRRPIFRWRFPEVLFEPLTWYELLRHEFVEMGVNDAVQAGPGWEPLETLANGAGWVRRVRFRAEAPLPGATAHLRGAAGCAEIVLHMRGEHGDGGRASCSVAVQERGAGGALIGLLWAAVPVGAWTNLTVPLTRPAVAGEPLAVTVAVQPGHEVAVQRVTQATRECPASA
jgi:SAM-dependent methyltransferase